MSEQTLGEAQTRDISGELDETSATAVPAPQTLGRYVLLRVLGSGAMGVVYLSYDPELDRRVAVKLLRNQATSARTRHEASLRMLREAQAIARLSHPNVVAVYDVGTIDGTVFMAMEFVKGATLRAWCRARPRSLPAVLAVLVDVACGLAAAHAAGVVHGDIKPDNLLVGDDGRARVLDFGVARHHSGRPEEPSSERELGPEDPEPLTPGALIGTPAYMSAEQICGARADARSDQFSFCVTAFEALLGMRPFGGDTIDELKAALLHGSPTLTEGDRQLPRALTQDLLRGLSRAPDMRWPDMQTLAARLQRHLHAPERRRRVALAGVVAVTALTIGAAGALFVRPDAAASSCKALHASAAATWNPTRRQELAARFAASGLEHGDVLATRTLRQLDAYAGRWTATVTDACLADTHHSPAVASLTQQADCLEHRWREFELTVARLVLAAPEQLSEAPGVISDLAPIEICSQRSPYWDVIYPRDPAARSFATGLRRRLAEAQVARATGQLEVCRETAEAVAVEAAARDAQALLAEARLLSAFCSPIPGGPESMEEVVWLAEGAQHDAVLARALDALIFSHMMGENEVERRRWCAFARALLRRVAPGSDVSSALHAALGHDAAARGDHQAAAHEFQLALDIALLLRPSEDPKIRGLRSALGLALYNGGRLAEAELVLTTALDLLPPGEIRVDILNNLGEVYHESGQLDRAEQMLYQSLTLTPPTDDYVQGVLQINIGDILCERGEIDEAEALYHAAEVHLRRRFGDDHSILFYPPLGLAAVASRRHDPGTAAPLLQRAAQLAASPAIPPQDRARYLSERARMEALRAGPGDLDQAILTVKEALALLAATPSGFPRRREHILAWVQQEGLSIADAPPR